MKGNQANGLANLQPDPRAATKHGLTTYLARSIAPPCRFCVAKSACAEFSSAPGATCRIAEDYQAGIQRDILALPHILPQDGPIVQEYSKLATALAIMDCYIASAGPFLPGAEKYIDVQPVLKTRAGLSSQLLRYAGELGLTPAARARLQATETGRGASLAAALADLARRDQPAVTAEQVRLALTRDAAEGEFEVAPEAATE